MTAKRFALVIDNGEYTFYDLSENGEIMNMIDTEDMLNSLHEENQYLKSLKWNQDCINEISIDIQQRQSLEKENE